MKPCTPADTAPFPPLEGDWLCAYEDRPDYAVTLAVLAGSLATFCPQARLLIASPLSREQIRPTLPPSVVHIPWRPEVGGWNVKPGLLKKVLRAGARTAAWVDADIFVHGDYRRRLPDDPEVLVVAEEVASLPTCDTGLWTERLGRSRGRVLPRQINSAFVRVGGPHLPLLRAWQEVCHSPSYLAEQARPFAERTDPFKGDQDILSALLASKEFSSVQYAALRSGTDIAHLLGAGGFPAGDRIATLWRGIPPLLHAHGYPKPWVSQPDNWLALNPYVCAVRALAVRNGWDIPWTMLPPGRAELFYRLACGNPALAGLPFVLRT